MPEWLQDASQSPGSSLPVEAGAFRLLVSVLTGLAIAWVYRRCVTRSAIATENFGTALILLSVLVAMTAMVIDNNIARAFSLVGALAIVRFRTVVEDTRDTAFVIFAVVAGMAAGVGNWGLCAVGVPIVGLVALARARSARRLTADAAEAGGEAPQSLIVRIGIGDDPQQTLEPAMRGHLADLRLVRAATVRQGAALELTYAVQMRAGSSVVPLVRELNLLKGVQHVELAGA